MKNETKSKNETSSKEREEYRFSGLSEAVSVAALIEQLLSSEHQWITNRLSWLFVSQSFCITAYTILSTSATIQLGTNKQITILRIGLPILGIICCAVVGLSVRAAERVGREIANERARLSKHINDICKTKIPLVGVAEGLRNDKWTYYFGSLPEHLPWVLALFWLILLIRVDVGV